VDSPISLIAHSRSGTSVVFRAFSLHPEVEAVGETANLIFTTWRALEQISGLTRYGRNDCSADASVLVRNAFLLAFPSPKRNWMHKPIGVPRIWRDFSDDDLDSFVVWYWRVFQQSFPNSRTFSVVRHPKDVFLSARRYHGFPEEQVWENQALMYRLMANSDGAIRTIVRHADLVSDPERTMRKICDAVDLTFDPCMLSAFDVLQVPAKGTLFGTNEDLLKRRETHFSHRTQHDSIPLAPRASDTMERYRQLLEQFDLPDDT
jgi:hypothetical protein